MIDLDNTLEIKTFDKGGVLSSIELLPDQMEQAWRETKEINFPESYSTVTNIIVVGMGGSGFTPEIVKSVFSDRLKIPFEVIHDYHLPNCADKDSLIFLSSYSGTTHEVLSGGKEALKSNLKMTGICRGAELATFLGENEIPSYIFKEKFNPSSQPRLGSGYMVIGIAGILKKCTLLELGSEEIIKSFDLVKEKQKLWSVNIPTQQNPIKKLANLFKNKIPIIVVAEFLEANGRALRNQLNESAKNFSGYHVIPELNHHLMEGLQFPKTNKENLIFLFINSNLYMPENQKRMKITKEVVEKNGIKCLNIALEGKTKLEQSLELLALGSYLSFYLSLLNGVDAQKVPWVNYFKSQMQKA